MLPLSLVGMGKGPSHSLVLSAESQKGFQQSLSYRRYAATPHIPSELPREHSKTIEETVIAHIVFIPLTLSLSPSQLKRFYEEKRRVGFGSATMAMEQAIERTAANIKWVKENRGHVLKWLTDEAA